MKDHILAKASFDMRPEGPLNYTFPKSSEAKDNPFLQWRDFALFLLKDAEKRQNTKDIEDILKNVLEYASNAYARAFVYKYGDETYHARKKEAELKAFQFLLEHLKKNGTTFDPFSCFETIICRSFEAQTENLHLLAKFCSPLTDRPAMSALWESVILGGQKDAAKILLGMGLKPYWNAKTSRGGTKGFDYSNTILHLVSCKKQFDIVSLFDKNDMTSFANKANSRGETPLHFAARDILPDFAEYLIDLGADKKATTKRGQTPIDFVRRTKSRVDHMAKLLDLLGKETTLQPHELFMKAAQSCEVSYIKKGQEKGGDFSLWLFQNIDFFYKSVFENISDSRLKAFRKQQKTLFSYLKENTIDIPPASDGKTVLHFAIETAAIDVVDLYASNPDNFLARDKSGKRPTELCTKQTHQFKSTPFYQSQEAQNEKKVAANWVVAKHCKKAGYVFQSDDFPQLNQSSAAKAWLEKEILGGALVKVTQKSRAGRKM